VRAVRVGAVLDGDDGDVVGDPVDHPVGAASGAVENFQFVAQRLANPGWVLGQGAVDELDGCRGDLLG
jgi:hypothetical protein